MRTPPPARNSLLGNDATRHLVGENWRLHPDPKDHFHTSTGVCSFIGHTKSNVSTEACYESPRLISV